MKQNKKFERISRDKTNQELIEYERESNKSCWWSKLAHPIELAGLIKRYHLVSSWFFLIFFAHFSILLHFTLKSFIHSFYTRRDQEKIKYFNTIYYPHLAGALPEPYLFNNLFFAMSIYYLSMRLLSAYHLIRNSVINSNGYKEIHISQINFVLCCLCELNLEEWIKLFWHTWNHDKEVKSDRKLWEAHLGFEENVQKQLDKLCRRDLMFHLNMVDFEECYKDLPGLWDIKRRKKRYQSWHCPPPWMRVSTYILKLGIIVTATGIVGASIAYLMMLFGMLYLELRNAFPADQETKVGEVMSVWRSHLAQPLHSLRLFEMFLLSILQLPQQYDCVLSVLDNSILTARTNKIHQVMLHDLELCNNWQLFKGGECGTCFRVVDYPRSWSIDLVGNNLVRKQIRERSNLESLCSYKKHNIKNEIEQLNLKIRSHIRLVSLLYSEFMNIRRSHSGFFNLVIIGNGIVMTYIMSLFFTVHGAAQLIILCSCFLACFVPIMSSLIFCAFIEKAFKNIYRVMIRLSVNKLGLLDFETIRMLLTIGEAFEKKEDRSYLVAGVYAITLDSVAPVSRGN